MALCCVLLGSALHLGTRSPGLLSLWCHQWRGHLGPTSLERPRAAEVGPAQLRVGDPGHSGSWRQGRGLPRVGHGHFYMLPRLQEHLSLELSRTHARQHKGSDRKASSVCRGGLAAWWGEAITTLYKESRREAHRATPSVNTQGRDRDGTGAKHGGSPSPAGGWCF